MLVMENWLQQTLILVHFDFEEHSISLAMKKCHGMETIHPS